MIAIVNISHPIDLVGENEYEVRIDSVVKAKFKHKISDGLVICMHQAAAAIEREKWMSAAKLLTGKRPDVEGTLDTKKIGKDNAEW